MIREYHLEAAMANSKPRLLRCLLVGVILLISLNACDSKDDGSPSSISGYNYTIEGIQEFYVNGQWGSNLGIGDGAVAMSAASFCPRNGLQGFRRQ